MHCSAANEATTKELANKNLAILMATSEAQEATYTAEEESNEYNNEMRSKMAASAIKENKIKAISTSASEKTQKISATQAMSELEVKESSWKSEAATKAAGEASTKAQGAAELVTKSQAEAAEYRTRA